MWFVLAVCGDDVGGLDCVELLGFDLLLDLSLVFVDLDFEFIGRLVLQGTFGLRFWFSV